MYIHIILEGAGNNQPQKTKASVQPHFPSLFEASCILTLIRLVGCSSSIEGMGVLGRAGGAPTPSRRLCNLQGTQWARGKRLKGPGLLSLSPAAETGRKAVCPRQTQHLNPGPVLVPTAFSSRELLGGTLISLSPARCDVTP